MNFRFVDTFRAETPALAVGQAVSWIAAQWLDGSDWEEDDGYTIEETDEYGSFRIVLINGTVIEGIAIGSVLNVPAGSGEEENNMWRILIIEQ